jgi:hypothetical protein
MSHLTWCYAWHDVTLHIIYTKCHRTATNTSFRFLPLFTSGRLVYPFVLKRGGYNPPPEQNIASIPGHRASWTRRHPLDLQPPEPPPSSRWCNRTSPAMNHQSQMPSCVWSQGKDVEPVNKTFTAEVLVVFFKIRGINPSPSRLFLFGCPIGDFPLSNRSISLNFRNTNPTGFGHIGGFGTGDGGGGNKRRRRRGSWMRTLIARGTQGGINVVRKPLSQICSKFADGTRPVKGKDGLYAGSGYLKYHVGTLYELARGSTCLWSPIPDISRLSILLSWARHGQKQFHSNDYRTKYGHSDPWRW